MKPYRRKRTDGGHLYHVDSLKERSTEKRVIEPINTIFSILLLLYLLSNIPREYMGR